MNKSNATTTQKHFLPVCLSACLLVSEMTAIIIANNNAAIYIIKGTRTKQPAEAKKKLFLFYFPHCIGTRMREREREGRAYTERKRLERCVFVCAFHALLAYFVYFVVKAVKRTDSLVFYLSYLLLPLSFSLSRSLAFNFLHFHETSSYPMLYVCLSLFLPQEKLSCMYTTHIYEHTYEHTCGSYC